MGSYLPSTSTERSSMLDAIGCASMDDLFSRIPAPFRFTKALDIPCGLSELEVRRTFEAMAAENTVFKAVFRGAGAYRHYIPASVRRIVGKERFLTAYTPYQAEISQGILQSIFEYQTMICELTGMDVSNASVYDGATAAAEAVAMCRERGRKTVFVSGAAHPEVIRTIQTYCYGADVSVRIVPASDGATDYAAFEKLVSEETSVSCLYLQQPNYFGVIEDIDPFAAKIHEAGGKFIMGCNPISLGLLRTPAECGADIAVGEGQSLGLPLSFGGPYLGFMAARASLLRKLPGRIVGETNDTAGRRAFVLTLQAREQHIRRENASSNICSNEALCALTAAVYLATMGPSGLREAASQCCSKAHYAAKLISSIPGFALAHDKAFFHEFVTACPDVHAVLDALAKRGILGGLPVDGGILWCVTELVSKAEIETLVDILKEVTARCA